MPFVTLNVRKQTNLFSQLATMGKSFSYFSYRFKWTAKRPPSSAAILELNQSNKNCCWIHEIRSRLQQMDERRRFSPSKRIGFGVFHECFYPRVWNVNWVWVKFETPVDSPLVDEEATIFDESFSDKPKWTDLFAVHFAIKNDLLTNNNFQAAAISQWTIYPLPTKQPGISFEHPITQFHCGNSWSKRAQKIKCQKLCLSSSRHN